MHKMKKLHSLGVKKHSNEFAVHGCDVLVSESLNQKINAVYQSLTPHNFKHEPINMTGLYITQKTNTLDKTKTKMDIACTNPHPILSKEI